MQFAPGEILLIKSVKLLISVRCLRCLGSRHSRGVFSVYRRLWAEKETDFYGALGIWKSREEPVIARAVSLNIPGLGGGGHFLHVLPVFSVVRQSRRG